MADPEQPTLFHVLAFEVDKAVAAVRAQTAARARPPARLESDGAQQPALDEKGRESCGLRERPAENRLASRKR